MTEVCYYCGAPATSKEHVPPAYLFPEQKDVEDGVDYRKNLLTVPSCDEHNSQKSKDDEYLLLILIFGYFNNKVGRDHFHAKIVRALTRRPAMLAALFSTEKPVTVDGEPTVAVDVDRKRFNRSIERVCQALCFLDVGAPWPKDIEVHTPVLLLMNDSNADKVNALVTRLSKAIIDCLKDTEKRGDNPDIFWYQLKIDRAKDRLLCRMVFFGGFDVFAISHHRLRDKGVV